MIQIHFLNGSRAGQKQVIRRLPCIVGRGPSADCSIPESGIWEKHLEISLGSENEIRMALFEGAMGRLNGEAFQKKVMRNGDLLSLGAAQVRLWLSEPLLKDWRCREWLTWILLGGICLGQIGLVYWLSSL